MILLSSIEFVTALYLTVFLLAVIRSAKLDFSYLGLNFFFLSGSMHVCFWCLILILGKIRMEESVLLPPKHFAVIMAIPGISFLVLVFFLLRINFYPDTLFLRATSQAGMLAWPFGDCRKGQIPRCLHRGI